MKSKVKSLEFMEIDRKLTYSKILALMLSINKEEEKVVAYYRLLGQIKLDINHRMLLHDFIFEPDETIEKLCLEVIKNLIGQEKNIVRFSLMKDLIIIMRAKDTLLIEEKKFFNKVKTLLEIPEEYMKYFEEEYERDQIVLEESIEEGIVVKAFKEQIAGTTAIGIPFLYLYYRGYLRNIFMNSKKKRLLLKLQKFGIMRRENNNVKIKDTLTAISMGALAYTLAKYFLNRKINTDREIKELVIKRAQKLHDRASLYLIKDINFINIQLQTGENLPNKETLQSRRILLENALIRIRESKPVLL